MAAGHQGRDEAALRPQPQPAACSKLGFHQFAQKKFPHGRVAGQAEGLLPERASVVQQDFIEGQNGWPVDATGAAAGSVDRLDGGFELEAAWLLSAGGTVQQGFRFIHQDVVPSERASAMPLPWPMLVRKHEHVLHGVEVVGWLVGWMVGWMYGAKPCDHSGMSFQPERIRHSS